MRFPATLLFAVALAACGGAPGAGTSAGTAQAGPSTELSPEINRLIAAAKSGGETDLDLAWGETTIGGGEAVKQFSTLFQKTYGFSVNMHFTPAPTMTQMAGKVAQEAAAGQKASTDIFLGSEGHFAALLQQNGLESYDYTQLSPRIAKDTVVTNDIGLEITSRFPGFSYNSNIIPEAQAPKTLADLLNPKWKGQLASEPNAASFDRVAFRPEWTPEKMRSYVQQLSGNISGLIRCEELERLSSGEFALYGMDCGSFEVLRQREKGAPLAHVIPEDGALAVFFFVGIPRTAAHPDLAKLYINLMMSEAGQKILYDTSKGDLHSLPGSHSGAELQDLQAKGIKPLAITPQFIIDHPEDVQLRDDLTKILTRKG
ncbi:MAG TPA: ABC transporter substrate-binding protein [Chloroflexota bacterium]|nr:ABC transporter substrate-binding protein [Chloroflexota bacterium]